MKNQTKSHYERRLLTVSLTVASPSERFHVTSSLMLMNFICWFENYFVLPFKQILISKQAYITFVLIHITFFRLLFKTLFLLNYGFDFSSLLIHSWVVKPISLKENRTVTVESAPTMSQIILKLTLVI